MYTYKNEILTTSRKMGFKDTINASDLAKLDELMNERAKDGWQLTTHSYISDFSRTQSAFLISFKKKQ
ncbi:DUF4177 domain-containing protein [Enterococcus sp. LJL99]